MHSLGSLWRSMCHWCWCCTWVALHPGTLLKLWWSYCLGPFVGISSRSCSWHDQAFRNDCTWILFCWLWSQSQHWPFLICLSFTWNNSVMTYGLSCCSGGISFQKCFASALLHPTMFQAVCCHRLAIVFFFVIFMTGDLPCLLHGFAQL